MLEELATGPVEDDEPPGVAFVRGFTETLARAALEYIDEYRSLLDEQTRNRMAS